jgi:uncharacterized protein (TIGR00290 family)
MSAEETSEGPTAPVRERKVRVAVSWSSGKDSAYALHELRRSSEFEVVGLLTTVTSGYDRVSMHGVRRSILEAQARALGLPMTPVEIPARCRNEEYEAAMAAAVGQLKRQGVEAIAFGDLFLEDVRAYREARLAGSGLWPVFPLWGRPTDALARTMIAAGLDARIVCLDPRHLPAALAGRRFDAALLAELPAGVDPCGERGEFHTCVLDGPDFERPIEVRAGPVVEREGFVFADLEPVGPAEGAPRPASR